VKPLFNLRNSRRPSANISREQIRNFLDQKLSPAEEAAFETQLESSPFDLEAAEGLQQLGSAQRFDGIISDLDGRLQKTLVRPKNRSSSLAFGLAAAAILMLALAFGLLRSPGVERDILQEYFRPYPDLVSTIRGNTLPEAVKNALSLYTQQNYRQALALFNAVLADDPEQPIALFYSGVILLKFDQPDAAVSRFQRIKETNRFSLREPLHWYLALGHYKLGNYASADSLLRLLEREPNLFVEDAREIRNTIKNIH